jgi:hypothetical protein
MSTDYQAFQVQAPCLFDFDFDFDPDFDFDLDLDFVRFIMDERGG